jgi:hypothetical protein
VHCKIINENLCFVGTSLESINIRYLKNMFSFSSLNKGHCSIRSTRYLVMKYYVRILKMTEELLNMAVLSIATFTHTDPV